MLLLLFLCHLDDKGDACFMIDNMSGLCAACAGMTKHERDLRARHGRVQQLHE